MESLKVKKTWDRRHEAGDVCTPQARKNVAAYVAMRLAKGEDVDPILLNYVKKLKDDGLI